jgi:hypothetical protein
MPGSAPDEYENNERRQEGEDEEGETGTKMEQE